MPGVGAEKDRRGIILTPEPWTVTRGDGGWGNARLWELKVLNL